MKVGVIPLRKGSKGIPGKNKKKLLGRPLFSWSLHEAAKSKLDVIYVMTDDEEIINYIKNEYQYNSKIRVMQRDDENASDTASTENVLIEFVNKYDKAFDTLTLIQATSPLITSEDINLALDAVISNDYDSALTVAKYKRFFWSKNGKPLNYDYKKRPRRQDIKGDYVENGACYTISYEQWNRENIRIGGKIKIIEMPIDTLIEIDEPSDFLIIEQLVKERLHINKNKIIDPKVMVFDVDGVFTDGKVTYTANGEVSKNFSLRDGMGISLLKSNGIIPVVITSENSLIVSSRMKKLKIDNVFLGVKDKFACLDTFLASNSFIWSEVAYMGDDINDLTNINAAGMSFCPIDASLIIKNHSDYILQSKGGDHAVREAIDQVLIFKNRN